MKPLMLTPSKKEYLKLIEKEICRLYDVFCNEWGSKDLGGDFHFCWVEAGSGSQEINRLTDEAECAYGEDFVYDVLDEYRNDMIQECIDGFTG